MRPSGPPALRLDALGDRICIMGPSNSGKSTLADAIARARGLEPVHLDRLYHLPHTDWVPRPEGDFAALHDAAIAGPRWAMDGNYSRLLPRRLARATGLILLDAPAAVRLARYLRRCWFERGRAGGLEGGRDSVKWEMLRLIASGSGRHRQSFDGARLPKVRLDSPAALAAFYRDNGLRRRRP